MGKQVSMPDKPQVLLLENMGLDLDEALQAQASSLRELYEKHELEVFSGEFMENLQGPSFAQPFLGPFCSHSKPIQTFLPSIVFL